MKLTKDAFYNPGKYAGCNRIYSNSYYEFDDSIVVIKEDSAIVIKEFEKLMSIKKATKSQIDNLYDSKRDFMQFVYQYDDYIFHTEGHHPSFYMNGQNVFRFDYHRDSIPHRKNGMSNYFFNKTNFETESKYSLNGFRFDKPQYLSIVL